MIRNSLESPPTPHSLSAFTKKNYFVLVFPMWEKHLSESNKFISQSSINFRLKTIFIFLFSCRLLMPQLFIRKPAKVEFWFYCGNIFDFRILHSTAVLELNLYPIWSKTASQWSRSDANFTPNRAHLFARSPTNWMEVRLNDSFITKHANYLMRAFLIHDA